MTAWLHPVLQSVATLLACYVLSMGVQRFRCNHLHAKVPFAWKRHVALGKAALMLWLIGLVVGVWSTQRQWGMVGLSGAHFYAGLAMVPLVVVGLVTGVAISRPAKRPKTVPLVHGAANTLALLLALWQVVTGIGVIRDYVLAAM
ncbi:MAG: DUF4079 family protein [Desulfovibrionaceae bacterium]|jgi:archaellum biogenesis protein FlaJ (TadC family)|nr:DUF4079 family protein [Desulfovibrionaceae bacterium]